jgi:carbamoyltransferase
MQRWISDKLWIKSILAKKTGLPASKILFAEHHVSHASASFFTSPFKEAAILTVDGAGEWTTSTMGMGRDRKVEILLKEPSETERAASGDPPVPGDR